MKKEEEKYYWSSYKCPYCGTDILVPSDIWRHKTKRCTTVGRTKEEIEEDIKTLIK